MFAFDDDIYLSFSKRHRSYHLKDLKSWILLQLQYKRKKEEGKKKIKRKDFFVLMPFAWVIKLDRCQNFK